MTIKKINLSQLSEDVDELPVEKGDLGFLFGSTAETTEKKKKKE